jgi:hypothetical protein
MKPIVADVKLVAYCGLYCGACGAYRRGRCPGCHENQKAAWCRVRTCCMENDYWSCAQCKSPSDPRDCRKCTNFISRLFGLIFRSDRRACIAQIRKKGLHAHAELMAAAQTRTIRR